MPLPQAIANAPELELGLDLFFVAFMDLTTCRAIGMAEGPIPWTAVRDYCDELLLEGDQREDMFHHIREMDTVYLKHRAKKSKKDTPDKAVPGKRPAVTVTKRAK
jgi:hypothetical protein